MCTQTKVKMTGPKPNQPLSSALRGTRICRVRDNGEFKLAELSKPIKSFLYSPKEQRFCSIDILLIWCPDNGIPMFVSNASARSM